MASVNFKKRFYEVIEEDPRILNEILDKFYEHAESIREHIKTGESLSSSIFKAPYLVLSKKLLKKYDIEQEDINTAFAFYIHALMDAGFFPREAMDEDEFYKELGIPNPDKNEAKK